MNAAVMNRVYPMHSTCQPVCNTVYFRLVLRRFSIVLFETDLLLGREFIAQSLKEILSKYCKILRIIAP